MPKVDQAVLDQAHACRICGDYEGARAHYQELLDANPEAPEVWWGMGLAIMNQGEFDEAIACIEKSTELDPSSQRYVLDLAKHYAMLGMDDEAKAAFERVIELGADTREGSEAASQLTYY